ncbi:MAG: AMP-binding protein [Bryobacterales bacterium]|nr:AMP-binding protein [Bryobacterales bacterium]
MNGSRPNLACYLDDFADAGSETAYVYARGLRTRRMSYRDLAELAWRTARWLRETERLAAGDRVILWGANSGEWSGAFWGCLAAGVVAVPVDAQASAAYVKRIAEETQAGLLLHGSENAAADTGHARCQRLERLSEAVAGLPALPPASNGITKDTLAQIIYTSGSTASPKGVCLTHGNTLASLEPLEREIARYRRWERPFHPVRFLVQLPLSHVFGQMMGLFIPPLLRGEMHFLPELSPADVADTIRSRRISVMATVPRYLEVLGAELRRGSEAQWGAEEFARRLEKARSIHYLRRWWLFRDVHRRLGWKFWAFVCGGASLPPETESLWHRLGYAVIQGYGMTETASLISVNHPFKMSRGSIGKSMPGREIRIGEGGEILVRGQNVSPGYWTRDGGVRPLAEDSAWFATGDLAEVDASGNLFFRGRSKELIVAANGMNIVPEDLEEALREEAEIRDAVVTGVGGANGPEPFAMLLPAHRPASGAGDLKAAVERANAHLETHQRITRWAVWPEPDFPRTATRKVRRAAVAEAARALASGRSMETTQGGVLEDVLAANGAHWEGPLDEDLRLGSDLGLDSLGRVQLLAALEGRFQVRLEESAFTEATTIRELREMLAGELPAGPDEDTSGDHESTNATGSKDAFMRMEATAQAARAEAAGVRPSKEHPYPFAEWPFSWWASAIRQGFQAVAMRPLTRFYSARARLVGVEHLAEIGGPALYVANHVTSVDGALLAGRLPWRHGRRLAIAMSGEMLRGYKYPAADEPWYWKLWLPLQYVLVVLVYAVFPLPRTSGFRRAFQQAGRLADRGYSILVFPEGRRSYTGEMQPFEQGIGILAKELGLPVVPVRLCGLHEMRERGGRLARKGELAIHLGRALRFSASEDAAAITRRLEAAVRAL